MAKNKGLRFLPLVFFLWVWACGGPAYFDLHLEKREIPAVEKTGKVLLVEDVEINQTYQDQRIVYRESPFQVKYYGYRLWSKPVADLIGDAVVDFWRNSPMFRKVNVYGSGDDADLTMRMKVNIIEKCHFRKNWFARLAADMEIFDSGNQETVVAHSFDRKMGLPGGKVRFLPEKISQILQEELDKIAAKLGKKSLSPAARKNLPK